MRDWNSFSGNEFLERALNREFPEYVHFLDAEGKPLAHNNLYHGEDLLTHIQWTIDHAQKLAVMMGLSPEERRKLVASAVWHDVGKAAVRAPKVLAVCQECGRPHPLTATECNTPGCQGVLDLREVTGYHGHEALGASRWMGGNILEREGFGISEAQRIRKLIREHDQVLYGIRDKKEMQYDPLAVLLSWSDEKSRIPPKYQPSLPDDVFEEYYQRGLRPRSQ